MTIPAMLDELAALAGRDERIRRRFLESRKEKNPVEAFCKVCRELGYEIYEMDLIGAGEEFYATIKRSTNGGGENSPRLDGQDDFYEMFFTQIS